MKEKSFKEVETIVKEKLNNNVLGPNRFTTHFFKACWHFLNEDIYALVEESHRMQWVWSSLNATLFTLIPKSNHANGPRGFRPIALWNVIYKIISFVIVRQLKPLLKIIIISEQIWFVKGRKIFNDIVTTHEIIHSLNHSEKLRMLFKMDLSKAYDRLN